MNLFGRMKYALVNLDDLIVRLLVAHTVSTDFARLVWKLHRPTEVAQGGVAVGAVPYLPFRRSTSWILTSALDP